MAPPINPALFQDRRFSRRPVIDLAFVDTGAPDPGDGGGQGNNPPPGEGPDDMFPDGIIFTGYGARVVRVEEKRAWDIVPDPDIGAPPELATYMMGLFYAVVAGTDGQPGFTDRRVTYSFEAVATPGGLLRLFCALPVPDVNGEFPPADQANPISLTVWRR